MFFDIVQFSGTFQALALHSSTKMGVGILGSHGKWICPYFTLI